MAEHISRGALQDIFRDCASADKRHPFPVFQCVQIKPLNAASSGATERYRLVLSDVNNYVQSMLATQANYVIKEHRLKRGNLVRLKGYQASVVKDKNILVVLALDVLEDIGPLDKIGEPTGLEHVGATSGPAPPHSGVPPQNAGMSGSGFYGNQVKKEGPSQTKAGNLGLPSRAPPKDRHNNNVIYPIEGVSPYTRIWTIKARVTQKSVVRTWHKQQSEGRLFSVNLLDESGEIKATGFNEQVDQYYDLLQEGSVYYISTPCKVNIAKKQFSNLPNDYELAFERDTVIEKADDNSSVPSLKIDAVMLENLAQREKDSIVDVVGVLKDVEASAEVNSAKLGKSFTKREIYVVDDSLFGIRVTLWGETATSFDAEPGSVIAFKGCKVSDFGGRSLSMMQSAAMIINPDINEAHRLRGWWDSDGNMRSNFHSHRDAGGATMSTTTGRSDEVVTIFEVKDKGLGTGEQPEYFTIKATIVYIKQDNFAYPACQADKCSKKLTDMGDEWRCESCDRGWERPNYRYIMNVNACDHTGQIWLTCFDDVGRVIMGMSADQLKELEESNEVAKQGAFDSANCRKLNFKCRAKMDHYGTSPRVRYQVISAAPLDYKLEGHRLADMIMAMSMER